MKLFRNVSDLLLCVTVGAVHKYLDDHSPEYVVLRPNWFFQNFEEAHIQSILEERTFYSASEDGKISFIDARVCFLTVFVAHVVVFALVRK